MAKIYILQNPGLYLQKLLTLIPKVFYKRNKMSIISASSKRTKTISKSNVFLSCSYTKSNQWDVYSMEKDLKSQAFHFSNLRHYQILFHELFSLKNKAFICNNRKQTKNISSSFHGLNLREVFQNANFFKNMLPILIKTL